MADVKWIKIVTDIFDDEKILMIETLPECDTIIVIWFKLLCLAGKKNNSGVFQMGHIPYTDEMFATIFRRPLNTVRLALNTFEQFGMVEIINDTVTIPNWEKHQSLDKLESAQAKTRQRVAKHREKQKMLAESNAECNVTCNVTVTQSNALRNGDVTPTDKIREEEKRIDKNKEKEEKENASFEAAPHPQQIVDLFNSICISFPSVRSLSEARKKAIKARLNVYTVEQFKTMFEMAEASPFLKGQNIRNWQANFDWLIKDGNFAKVLDGNYSDKKAGATYGANGVAIDHSKTDLDDLF